MDLFNIFYMYRRTDVRLYNYTITVILIFPTLSSLG